MAVQKTGKNAGSLWELPIENQVTCKCIVKLLDVYFCFFFCLLSTVNDPFKYVYVGQRFRIKLDFQNKLLYLYL